MAVVTIVAFIALIIGVLVVLSNRDLLTGKQNGQRRRRESALPFLFFPTTGPTADPAPVPAWHTKRSDLLQTELAVRPEPGIADLPAEPESDIADLRPR